MKRIPKKVSVLGQRLDVIETNDRNILGDTDGKIIPDLATVVIRKKLPQDQKWEVFLHEIGHMIGMCLAFGDPYDCEEKYNAYMVTYFGFLRDNQLLNIE